MTKCINCLENELVLTGTNFPRGIEASFENFKEAQKTLLSICDSCYEKSEAKSEVEPFPVKGDIIPLEVMYLADNEVGITFAIPVINRGNVYTLESLFNKLKPIDYYFKTYLTTLVSSLEEMDDVTGRYYGDSPKEV